MTASTLTDVLATLALLDAAIADDTVAEPTTAPTGEATLNGFVAIENGLHWVMDMVFRDDECRIRKNNAPANFTTIKHIASNILRSVKGKT